MEEEKIEEQDELFIPVLRYFEYNNIWTGRWGSLRFRIAPDITMLTPKEVNMEESSMKAEFWHGIYCYEKSEMEGEQVFPLSLEGREAMRQWLLEQV